MSRADRIINRKAWFSQVGSWFGATKRTEEFTQKESGIRKSWRHWLAEWRVFHTHSATKIKAMVEQQKLYAEAMEKRADELDGEASNA